jgi:hypothetical protein
MSNVVKIEFRYVGETAWHPYSKHATPEEAEDALKVAYAGVDIARHYCEKIGKPQLCPQQEFRFVATA